MSTYPSGYGGSEAGWGGRYADAELYQQRPQHLTPSKDLGPNWEVVEGPEIQGWALVDNAGDRIGSIDDVLVDTDSGRAVFAIARIGGAFGLGGKRTLTPVHLLDLDPDNRRVIAPLSRDVLSQAPEFTGDTADLAPFYDYWDQRQASTGPAIEEQEARAAEEEMILEEETIIIPGARIRVAHYRRIDEPEERRQAYG